MKTKHLLFSILFLLSISVNAQTEAERAKIAESTNKAEVESLKTQFKRQYVISEEKILKYLKKNPKVKRTFVKDGSTYYLQKIDRDGNPLYINSKSNRESSKLIKADQLYNGGSVGVNITGEGMIVGVWDTGEVRATHELLAGQVTMQPNQTLDGVGTGGDKYGGNDHMTHVTGTIVGKDLPNKPFARGIAYGAKALCYDTENDYPEMTDFASKGYLISNHSYGFSNAPGTPLWLFGAYNDGAKDWDKLTRTFPYYLPFVAGGNEQENSGNRKDKLGYDIMTGTSAAKNVMTVGAVDGDKAMSDYSNWGPTDDGRVKPEIVTRGTGINSSMFADKTTKTPSDTSYYSEQGTSMASPAAAAGGLLLQQYYNSLNKSYMKSSTLKALMLATAEDLGQPGPDHKFGWGLLNIEKAANTIKYKSAVGGPTRAIVSDTASKGSYIEEITLKFPADTTTEVSREVTASGCEPLIISIGWTDIEGKEQTSDEDIDPTTSRLVYDYDLIVTNVSKNTTFRAWKPSVMENRTEDATHELTWFDGNPNNFKQVKIENAVAGDKYKIFLRKKTTSPDSAQMLSLVVTGTAFAKPLLATTQNFCSPSTATIADLTVTGSGIKWYDATTGGSALPTTTALSTGKTYFASQTIVGCESSRAAIAITVTPALEVPSAHDVTSKFDTKVDLPATCKAGTPVWYNVATGGTALASGTFTTPELSTNTIYHVACEAGKNPTCASTRTRQIVRMSLTNAIETPLLSDSVLPITTKTTESTPNASNARVANEGNNTGIFINVFPNPSTGIIAWKVLTDEPTGITLMMYNSMGKEQMTENSPTQKQVHEGTIDLQKFNTGVYFLKFVAGEKTVTEKIIKQ
ncbi:MAG: S8 family serine peptidase [Arcicella sp.]|nr:S8 family serine peptidase [Arcicella sp.]